MNSQTTNGLLLPKYFCAWSRFDTDQVKEIFDVNAVYQMTGKRTLVGIDEILKYWERNKKRQKNLTSFPPVMLRNENGIESCTFCASFTDIEESQNQTVYGHIEVETKEGKISRLVESYKVFRKPSSIAAWYAPLTSFLIRSYWLVKALAVKAFEFLLTRVALIASVLMATLLGYSAFNLHNLPDSVICGITLNFSQCSVLTNEKREILINSAYRTLSVITSIYIFFVMLGGWLRNYLRSPIRTIPLQAQNHDLMEMKRRFSSAQGITIFGGDFDFISYDQELRQTFLQLSTKGSLVLVSEKKEDDVRRGFGETAEAVTLFESLKQERKIHFDKGVPIRCSIVRHWFGSEILYRYKGGGSDSLTDLHLCVLRGRREADPMIDLVKKLAARVVVQ